MFVAEGIPLINQTEAVTLKVMVQKKEL